MSGTELAYGGVTGQLWGTREDLFMRFELSLLNAWRRPTKVAHVATASYAAKSNTRNLIPEISEFGTELAYGSTFAGTELAYGSTFAGTELAYGSMFAGTELAYGPTRRQLT
eukprot:3942000-Rhodomonas_salina.4